MKPKGSLAFPKSQVFSGSPSLLSRRSFTGMDVYKHNNGSPEVCLCGVSVACLALCWWGGLFYIKSFSKIRWL